MYHFLVADDHPLFREALLGIIHQHYPGATISESNDLESTLLILEQQTTDLLLLDLNMPGSQDLFGLITIREKHPSTPVMIISASESPSIIHRATEYGASGFIPKSSSIEHMHLAIDKVINGETWFPDHLFNGAEQISDDEKTLAAKISALTPQQYRVLCYLREGQLNKQIAYSMSITEATVKAHITAIFKKLGVNNRTQAVIELSKFSAII